MFQALFSSSNGLAIFKEQYFEYKTKMNQRFFDCPVWLCAILLFSLESFSYNIRCFFKKTPLFSHFQTISFFFLAVFTIMKHMNWRTFNHEL
ncbi:hypothetical protein C6N14_07530 [Enterococcus mundtii]|uniref:Uncharacterized protein n=1 Tax=Enterococcus mundtii TaxID=53346 RepID=A0A2T5DCK0_ENTMU|nr:hypothetical protein C6N14_07530 [Enterococcus mundtii]